LPPVQRAADKVQMSRAGIMKAAGVALLSLSALVLVITSHTLPAPQTQELFGGGNGDLMSSLSSDSDSSSSFEHTMSNANNYFRRSASHSKDNKWMSQLDALKQKQINRRKKEDAEYFSGVEKAFGKKAGLAMMSAFDGHGKHSSTDKMLAKLQVDNKKIAARKAEVSHETLHPKDDGVKEVVAHAQAKASKAKEAEKKEALVKAKAKASKAKANALKKGVVAEALKVADKMGKHVDPVAHAAKKVADKAKPAAHPAVAAKPAEKKKGVDVNHPGVVAASVEMQKVVHEFKKAHGKEKKVLKARVMQLQQQIVNDFKAVTNVGVRASTKFAREEAAEKHKK